jgi:hypothetical protein
MIVWNVGNQSLNNTVTSQKTRILNNTAVRITSHEVLVRGLFVKSELCVCNSGITWVLFLVCQRVVTVLYLTVSIHFVYASLYLADFWLGVVIVHLVLAHVQGWTDSPACLSVVSGKIFVFKFCNYYPTLLLFLYIYIFLFFYFLVYLFIYFCISAQMLNSRFVTGGCNWVL